ncbi:MAG: response regulator [Chloroflexaceae bacterium]|nr:response regulator [Chloroflexaceae bacterium]
MMLFDLTQTLQVTCELKKQNVLDTRLVLIDAEQVIAEAKTQWQAWQAAKVADRSPDKAPQIVQPEQLQQRTSPQIYQTLTQLLDGEHTLRDLAVRMKRDVLMVTRSLLPYLQLGLIKLTEVGDLPAPLTPSQPASPGSAAPAPANGELIACIDDSPSICHSLERIVSGAGYQFLGISDPLRAIAVLLVRKPNLIFLDLVMPSTNGYEICAQLRKLTLFRDTPIVILTGNDGIIDRVRAKMVGSTDFVSKPVKSEVVLSIIRKYLKQSSPS